MTAHRKLSVLVTGAGGLIGGDLCGRLLDREHDVVGLVHRRPAITRNDGAAVAAQPWTGAIQQPGKAAFVHGDVARVDFGLERDDARRLAAAVDLMVHCAGVTGFDLPTETYRAVNIEGARNAAAFCLLGGRAELLHVSTAYVRGRRSGPVAEAPVDPLADFTNPYESSKAAAETVILDARKLGLRAAIARPSIVVGAWADGTIGRFDHLYILMKLVAEGRLTALPGAAGATLDLVPVDHVTEGLADMAEGLDQVEGAVAHLSSGQPTALSALVDLGEDFPDLIPPRFVSPQEYDPTQLRPSEQRLYDRAAALYAAYLGRNPCFATQTLSGLSGRICPPLGRSYLKRLVAYAVARGFVRPPTAQRTSG